MRSNLNMVVVMLVLVLVLVVVQVCTNGLGTCTAGTDLTVCSASLEYQCGTSNLMKQMLLDECGGHASPYHFHAGLAAACEWLWRGGCACGDVRVGSMFVCGRLELRVPVQLVGDRPLSADRCVRVCVVVVV